MRLLFITNNFPPIVDGVGDYTYHLAQEFAKNGQEVNIICTAQPEIIAFAKGDNLNFKLHPIVKNWNMKGIYIAYRQVKQLRPDWVLLQYVPYSYQSWGMPVLMSLFFLLTRISGIPTITTFHEIAIRWDFKNPKYFFIGFVQRKIAYLLTILSKKTITSIGSYTKMLKGQNKECYHIPIGSNILPCSNGNSTNLYQKKENNIIVTFGRRDLHLLLSAFEILVEKDAGVTLKIVGKTSDYVFKQVKKIKPVAQKQICLTGYLDEPTVFKELLEADIFVLPEIVNNKGHGGASLKSGALAAALAAGLPVISTYGDMTDDFLANSGAIKFCDYSVEGFQKKISELLQQPHELEKMKNNANLFYNRHLTWDIIANRYLNIIAQKDRLELAKIF